MAKRIWFILAGIWLVLSTGYFVWHDTVMFHITASVACGYPGAPKRAYDACMAARLPQVDAALWRLFLPEHWLSIVAPALVLITAGVVLKKRAR